MEDGCLSCTPGYFLYWGKTDRFGDGSYHLLPYHSLDVAAVAAVLLARHPSYCARLARLFGLSTDDVSCWIPFLIALHDIGKFADSFQNLNASVRFTLRRVPASERCYSVRHDSLGWGLWKDRVKAQFQDRGLMPSQPKSRYLKVSLETPLDFFMAAVLGHHGQPPKAYDKAKSSDDFDQDADFEALEAFIDDAVAVFLSDSPSFPECDLDQAKQASWWLAGFAVLCDWLGSNRDLFPYRQEQMSLDDYYQKHALPLAEKAVAAVGVFGSRASDSLRLADILDLPKGAPEPEMTPLQAKAADWPVGDGPQLLILEDVTGAGKTEAATLLAHRLMAAGQGEGLYFALPTMATADGMYRRMSKAYQAMFCEDARPSLVLAHGGSRLSKDFTDSILPMQKHPENGYDKTPSAGAHCNAWLADNRKKALLADVGIGTIDQALLAIMASRHQSLRLLGLLNKILIVDEVHACDEYMHTLLKALIRAQASVGGSVILLSATLSTQQRQSFLNAYAKGWGMAAPRIQQAQAYPLLTGLSATGLRETPVATRPSSKRSADVAWLHSRTDVERRLQQVQADGRCACWVVNTVKDAVEVYLYLQAKYPGWSLDLFHARFAVGDRQTISKRVLARFGKRSTAEQRCGQILIATQVVEQSLDLDFDVLISDLAPIDLLIQRAGRLCRHARDEQGNLIEQADQRGTPVLYLHSPPPVDEPGNDWFAKAFPYAQKVYANHGQLWLGARLLLERGVLCMPEDARRLVEGVYAADDDAIPDALRSRYFEAEGDGRAQASHAAFSSLNMDAGYDTQSATGWIDETRAVTRLGEETVQVYLARWQNGELTPWHNDPDHPWPMSCVSIAARWLREESLPPGMSADALEQYKQQLPAQGRWGVLMPLQLGDDGRWRGTARNDKQETVGFTYTEYCGLVADLAEVNQEIWE